jgi:hypothetical protein
MTDRTVAGRRGRAVDVSIQPKIGPQASVMLDFLRGQRAAQMTSMMHLPHPRSYGFSGSRKKFGNFSTNLGNSWRKRHSRSLYISRKGIVQRSMRAMARPTLP